MTLKVYMFALAVTPDGNPIKVGLPLATNPTLPRVGTRLSDGSVIALPYSGVWGKKVK